MSHGFTDYEAQLSQASRGSCTAAQFLIVIRYSDSWTFYFVKLAHQKA